VTWQEQSFYPGQDDVLPDHQVRRDDVPAPRHARHSSNTTMGAAAAPNGATTAPRPAGGRWAALRSVVRAGGPRRPAAPALESLRPVVIGPPPPARIPALANSCFWCNRPLTDFESRQLGADPNCVKRRGAHQVYTLNPHYIAWGNALHALRVQQNSERPAVVARNRAAMEAHAEALAAWEAARRPGDSA
jgi:hypothetical protein